MKKFTGCILAAFLVFGFGPQSFAQDEGEGFDGWGSGEEGEDTGGSGDEGAEAGGTGDEGGAAEDPWEAPETAETDEPEPASEPEVALPTGYPVSEIDRPLALPPMTLEPRLSFHIDIMDPGDNWFSMHMGAGFGIIDKLEAGLQLPLSFAPNVEAGIGFYGMYELGPFLSNKFFTAARLQFSIPFDNDVLVFWPGAAVAILADAPMKFKFHDMFAAIGSLGLGGYIGADNTKDYFLLFFDFGALVQPIEALALTLEFGIHGYLGDNSEGWYPMKFRGQYTLIGDLDVFVEFGFPNLDRGADWVQLLFGAAYRIGF